MFRAHFFHHVRKGLPKRLPAVLVQSGGGQVRVSARPVADFMGDGGRQAGEGGIERLEAGLGAGKYPLHEPGPVCSQRIFLVLGVGDEIILAGKHLADGADHAGNVLDAVDDYVVFIAENDVAVFAHQLHDELLGAQVPHFIQMLDLKIQNPLHAGLGDGENPAVLDMFAQEHTEVGSSHGAGFIFSCEKCEREGSRRGQGEPVLAAVVFYGKKQLIRLRLGDFIDPSACERIGKLLSDCCDSNTVKCHDQSSFLK